MFAYYDDIETINRKKALLQSNFQKHVAEVLAHCADEKAMAMELRANSRTPAQFVRRQIVSLCSSARSWCYANGNDVFGGIASDHAKAMRAGLIVELNIWRAAYRQLKATPDIEIMGGGIALIVGLTSAGIEWIRANVSFEPWQVQNCGIACEPDYARYIAFEATNDGLTVK